jgi:cation diffusion facilitator CzcD-associated flavoprotein CzcO
LRAYATEFGLYPLISFNKRVTKAERTTQGWRISIEGESAPRLYAGLVVADGHHWEPNVPSYPGRFTGEVLHSHDVKSKEQLKGKRLLVVGRATPPSTFCRTRRSTAAMPMRPASMWLPQTGSFNSAVISKETSSGRCPSLLAR